MTTSSLTDRTLETSVLDLVDRAAVQDVLVRYCLYADAGMVEEWLVLFHSDAWMDLPDYTSTEPAATIRLSGRDGLRGLIEAPGVVAIHGRSQHHMATPGLFTVAGDEATWDAHAVVFILPEDGGGPTDTSLSFNRWSFRRTVNGGWLIASCVRRRVAHSDELLHAALAT